MQRPRHPSSIPFLFSACHGTRVAAWGLTVSAVVLAGCASGPSPSPGSRAQASRPAVKPVSDPAVPPVALRPGPAPTSERDGPEPRPPTGLVKVSDAEPQLEDIRDGGPNRPYRVLGRNYTPMVEDRPFSQRGLASWYGKKFHGRRTASGEPYNMYAMTAAHPTLPIPSYVRVRNPANGREVVVRVNDRGPFHAGRVIDLSYTAALKLDVLRGVAQVELDRITYDDIRTGAWRRQVPVDVPTPAGEPATDLLLAEATAAGRPRGEGTGEAPAPVTTPVPTPSPIPVPAQSSPVLPSAATVGSPLPAGTPVVVALAREGAAPAATRSIAATSLTASAPSQPQPQPEVDTVRVMAVSAPGAASAVPLPLPVADAVSAASQEERGFWVQLAAFRQRDGADGFHRRVGSELQWLAPLLTVFSDTAVHRLQAGPYTSREAALGAAQRVREALSLVPVVVERR